MTERPRIAGILETAVYVDDLAAAHAFYGGVLGLTRMLEGDRLMAYDVAPAQVLLVFLRGGTLEDMSTPGGVIPGHNSVGHSHFAFAIRPEDVSAWRAHLEGAGIEIISEVTWPAGGTSLYFNDPDGNVLEVGSPPNWPNFSEVSGQERS